MTRITLDLTDTEIQMILFLLNGHKEEIRNPMISEVLHLHNLGLETTRESREKAAEDIEKTKQKIMKGYQEGIWIEGEE